MHDLIKNQHILPGEERRGVFYLAIVTLLRDRGNLSKVSRETEISYNYIVRLSKGENMLPDVTRMEKLYTYLTGADL